MPLTFGDKHYPSPSIKRIMERKGKWISTKQLLLSNRIMERKGKWISTKQLLPTLVLSNRIMERKGKWISTKQLLLSNWR